MAELKPVKTEDIRGAACCMSVAKANSAIKGLEEGQVLELFADGCGAGDTPVWARAVGHELIAVRRMWKVNGWWRSFVCPGLESRFSRSCGRVGDVEKRIERGP